MLSIIAEFTLVFVLSSIFMAIVRYYAPVFGLIDIPNNRSIHHKQTPRGAGIGFFLAVLVVFPFFHGDLLREYPWTFVATLSIFIIGVLDDHHDTSPNTKFIVIIIATLLLYFDGIYIQSIGSFFGFPLVLGWLALPFTVFAVVGFTNALNLIDGLDGLAATVSIVILAAFLWVGLAHHDMFMIVLSSLFIATLLAFLIYNWHPASIFMGDSGSLVLGFVIALLAVKSLAYLPAVSILFVAAVPILDTVIVMVRRKIRGRSMFSADRCHIHHILRHFFAEDTQKTVLFLGVLQVIYSLTGLQLHKGADAGVVLVLFVFNTIMLYMFLAAMIKRQQRDC